MNSQLTNYLRRSPYLSANLAKYAPGSRLHDRQFQNRITIEETTPNLAMFINYQNYQPQQAPAHQLLEVSNCVICQSKDQDGTLMRRCKECLRHMCAHCQRKCSSCNLIYCRLEMKYNYEQEADYCSNCS